MSGDAALAAAAEEVTALVQSEVGEASLKGAILARMETNKTLPAHVFTEERERMRSTLAKLRENREVLVASGQEKQIALNTEHNRRVGLITEQIAKLTSILEGEKSSYAKEKENLSKAIADMLEATDKHISATEKFLS